MKNKKTLTMLLAVSILFTGLLTAQESKKDQELFKKAKTYIFQKDWDAAIKNLEVLVKDFQQSEYLEESFYWLGSNNIGSLEQQLETKEKAVGQLNILIDNHKLSSWLDDAKILRVELAEELVSNGLTQYRSFINGSILEEELVSLEGLEELGTLEEM